MHAKYELKDLTWLCGT